ETGQLDYLTEGGLSPKGGRRMSTSSVGSSRTGGGGADQDPDRDSLLPNQAQQQQQQHQDAADSSGSSTGGRSRGRGGGGRGSGGDEDAASSSSARGEDAPTGFLSPARFRSQQISSPGFMSPPVGEGGGGGSGRSPKPHSGRSWKAPQFAIDSDNSGPGVLLEHSPTRPVQHRRPAATDEAFPLSGSARSLSPSPGLHRFNMQQQQQQWVSW
ncbi:unnamed protein product, partial [Hapterophycus canaliculatus]